MKSVALYGGGFKPPTKGHFEVVLEFIKNHPQIDEFIIFVGKTPRENITQEISFKIWEIYKKYLPNNQNIKTQTSDTPIGDIIRYIKSNQNEKIYFVLGARKNNTQDYKAIQERTLKIKEKYPNLEITIVESEDNSISGSKARQSIIKQNYNLFSKFLPEQLSEEDKQQIWELFPKELNELEQNEIKYWALYYHLYKKLQPSPKENYIKIKQLLEEHNAPKEYFDALDYFYYKFLHVEDLNENATYSEEIDYKQHIKELTKYYLLKNPHIKQVPKVKFIDGDVENASTVLTKTGHYDPNTKTIVLYTEGRHPRDIVSSFSHEFSHFLQDIKGKLSDINTDNTLEDNNLDKIEREAYEEGNIVFRNWKDSIKEKKSLGIDQFSRELAQGLEEQMIHEGIYDSLVTKLSKEILTHWKADFENNKTQSVLTNTYEFFDKKNRELFFELEAKITFKKTKKELYLVDGEADLDKDKITLKFVIDPRSLPRFWSEVSADISDVLRHEIEHLTQEGYNKRKELDTKDTYFLRDLIKSKIMPEKTYFLLPDEVDAMLNGLYLKSKKTKTPLLQTIKTYLEYSRLSKEDQKEILQVWIPRAKQLSLLKEDNSKYKIYTDMDGCLVNFDKRFIENFGMLPKEFELKYGKDKFWEVITKKGVGFWVGMEWMEDGKEYWEYIKKYNPIILSAPSRHDSSKLGKRLWKKNHLPEVKLILTPAEQKQNFASPNSILIDDYGKNIDQWKQAGGIGILHTSAENTINQLKKLGL